LVFPAQLALEEVLLVPQELLELLVQQVPELLALLADQQVQPELQDRLVLLELLVQLVQMEMLEQPVLLGLEQPVLQELVAQQVHQAVQLVQPVQHLL
jgi:hypothetical protein